MNYNDRQREERAKDKDLLCTFKTLLNPHNNPAR